MPLATGLPTGKWTALLIGDQWPTSTSLDLLASGAGSRHNLARQLEQYSGLIRTITDCNLGLQEGVTAEEIRGEFKRGESFVTEIAQKNAAKSHSYRAAHGHVVELRNDLKNLAEMGNRAIEEVDGSGEPLSGKIRKITEIIVEVRRLAVSKAATTADNIYCEIQSVLNTQGLDISARAFASENGLIDSTRTPVDTEKLSRDVTDKLQPLGEVNSASEAWNQPGSTDLTSSRGTDAPVVSNGSISGTATTKLNEATVSNGFASIGQSSSGITGRSSNLSTSIADSSSGMTGTRAPEHTMPGILASTTTTQSSSGTTGKHAPEPAISDSTAPTTTNSSSSGITSVPASSSLTPASPVSPTTSESSTGITGGPVGSPLTPNLTTTDLSSTPPLTTPSTPALGAATIIEAPTPSASANAGGPLALNLSPSELAQSFNTGTQAGVPVSAGTEAVSSAAASQAHTPPPAFHASFADINAPATPGLETAHAAPPPAPDYAQIAHAPTELAQPVIAAAPTAPIVAASPVAPAPVAVTPSTPPAGLLGYGADLRPPTAAAIPPTVTPAAPGSAPVTPASGSAPSGQPAVVRQQPTAAAAHTAAVTGLTERAFAATATGAAAGATAAGTQAEARLRRLLDVVARQQPELRWAVGDREDGSTVLVTDLAHGWIPPHIVIPTGLRLLQPGNGRTELTALLGETTLSATYVPGQYLGPEDQGVQMSIRARDIPAVEDLGWELSESTRWRDGLPRLAHTLARAVSAKTGCLDSEVDMLRQYLGVVSRSVLKKYPDTTNAAQVGNWQLLATIEALINDERTSANYHFAWFQAQNRNVEANR